MIELVLFSALGFLVAALLGLIVAPAIYRRVVKLTERRMRATVPLNAAEIKATKDMERAEFAAQNSRISVELRKEREHLVEVEASKSRLSETVIRMRGENEELQTSLADLKTESGNLRSSLRKEESKLETAQKSLETARKNNQEKERQILSLIDRANRLETEVGSQKIDLASKDTEAEILKSTIDSLKNEQLKLNNNQAELENRVSKLRFEVEREQERANSLHKRLDTTTEKLKNRDQKLKDRAEEITQLKDKMRSVKADASDLRKSLRTSETERRKLERRLTQVEKQLERATGKPAPKRAQATAKITKPASKTETKPKIVKYKRTLRNLSAAEINDRVEKLRLRHNALVEDLKKRSAPTEDAEFRKELAEIAAMMVDLTAAREGMDSKIHDIFDKYEPFDPMKGRKPNLADRSVRRIEKSNSPLAN